MKYEYHRKETSEFSGTAISLEGLIWPFLETLSSNPNLPDVNIQAMKQAWRINQPPFMELAVTLKT